MRLGGGGVQRWEEEGGAPVRTPAGAREAPEPVAKMPSRADGCGGFRVRTAARTAGQARGCVWVGSATAIPVFPIWCQF